MGLKEPVVFHPRSRGDARRVLFCTEGTYPYVHGGVSTWCDQICAGLPEYDFVISAVVGDPYIEFQFQPPPSVAEIDAIPLWAGEEPSEFIASQSVGTMLQRRRQTTDRVVKERFVPILQDWMAGFENETNDVDCELAALVAMHEYFEEFDYKATWRSRETWDAFCAQQIAFLRARNAPDGEYPNLFELTTGLRWLYNFMTPVSRAIPDIDLSHTTIAASCAIPAIVARTRDGVPFLCTDHGVYVRERYIALSQADMPLYSRRFLMRLAAVFSKLCYRTADIVSPVARFNARWEMPFGVEDERIRVVYNGVDTDQFVPGQKQEQYQSRPIAVAAARVFPLKDIETMIRAAAVTKKINPDILYLVYGSLNADPPYVERCRALIEELDVADSFVFGGFAPSAITLFQDGDISVLSSISEGFPYTILEAMSSGLACVGTDVGGVREAIGDCGVTVAPRDPEAFGTAVAELLSDLDYARQMGMRARERVVSTFRIQNQLAGYRELYAELQPTSPHALQVPPTAARAVAGR